jgi:hypothetical protein
MPDSAWLVGSVRIEAGNIEVNGNNHVTPAGTYYLRHANDALSLLEIVEDLIQLEEATATLFVTENRTLRLLPTAGNPVSIDWLSNTALRDLLGWTANLASSDDPHDAPNVSPLLWSPGWVATPATLLGTDGYVVTDATRHVSTDGLRTFVTTYYEQVQQDLAWTEVLAERLRVPMDEDGGGTFHEFYEQVLKRGYSIRYYEEQTEVDGSTTAVVWNDAVTNSFGPYVLREADPRWYRRVIANADLYGSLELPLMQVAEYT